MNIKIEKLTPEQIKQMGIENWPIWTKEPSTFDWYYDEIEKCYFLEGKVIVEFEGGSVEINKVLSKSIKATLSSSHKD